MVCYTNGDEVCRKNSTYGVGGEMWNVREMLVGKSDVGVDGRIILKSV
jgi:hypothetical protein